MSRAHSRHCVPHVITMMAVPAINDSVEKKNVKKKIHTLFVSGPSIVLLLKPSLLSAMVVVAVRCRFVHVASNKKSFSKVKKKVKKVTLLLLLLSLLLLSLSPF